MFEKRACPRKRGHSAALPVNVDCLDLRAVALIFVLLSYIAINMF
jgi:hypothetical protein